MRGGGGGLIEDLWHNSTGNACYAGYALLAAILVSYAPREQASGILGGTQSLLSRRSHEKKRTAVCCNNDAVMQMAFRKPV